MPDIWPVSVTNSVAKQLLNKVHTTASGFLPWYNFDILRYDFFFNQVWSPFPLPGGTGSLQNEVASVLNSDRPVYTHEEYINLVLRSGMIMSHDYTTQSLEEDPRMMAFFDSLVQVHIF